ncbi:MAG: response regulator [Deltaproteobacteria bacterium]|nr:response regulator [Deltaproteobacteria bacterium]
MPVEAEGRGNLLRMALTDISAHKLLEDRLRQSHKMEALGTLAGGIAHEFNNVLGGITNYAELAKVTMPDGSPEFEYLTDVLELCKRARDVVRQILSYSHRHGIEKRPVAVQSVIADTVKLLRLNLPPNIEIRQDIDALAGIVLGDRTQIQQVLINLCNNAAFAMKQSGGLLTVTVTSVVLDDEAARSYADLQPGAYVKLIVSDTGTGFDPAIIDFIFDPFFTTKGVGEGTGMGLSVVQGIVKNHGGIIAAASTPGEGTTFTVFLPRPADAAPVEAKDATLPRGTERILLVDDEDFIVISTKMMLKNLGYRVTALTDSLEALELFRKNPDAYDLVITDLTMPFLSGDQLAVELIKIRKDIPVAIATGYVNAADNGEVQKSGIRVVILKPYGMRELAKSIRFILDAKQGACSA